MKVYITFRPGQLHHIGTKTFDCETVAVINCSDYYTGEVLALSSFGGKFCTVHHPDNWTAEHETLYTKGLVELW